MNHFIKGLIAAVLLTSCASVQGPLLTADERERNVASFDYAWQKVNDEYWDPDFGGVDWQVVREELRPRVTQAETMDEARSVMREMISRLGSPILHSFLSDYRAVDGILIAHMTRVVVVGQERVITTQSVEQNVALPADQFVPPSKVKTLIQ